MEAQESTDARDGQARMLSGAMVAACALRGSSIERYVTSEPSALPRFENVVPNRRVDRAQVRLELLECQRQSEARLSFGPFYFSESGRFRLLFEAPRVMNGHARRKQHSI
jgi:hypothetical protein